MQARYENCDGTISYGQVVGRGEFPWRYEPFSLDGEPVMRPTVQVCFTDGDTAFGERVESLFVDDKWLTLGVFEGTHASTLSA